MKFMFIGENKLRQLGLYQCYRNPVIVVKCSCDHRPSVAISATVLATVAMVTAGGSRLVSNFRTTISRKLNNDSLCQKVLITGLFGYLRGPVFIETLCIYKRLAYRSVSYVFSNVRHN